VEKDEFLDYNQKADNLHIKRVDMVPSIEGDEKETLYKEPEDLILDLFQIGAIKFGEFTLASGDLSPYYVDLRLLVSYPRLLAGVSHSVGSKLSNFTFDRIAGIPYAGLPIATAIALEKDIPMIYMRKEIKTHGLGKQIEGLYIPGNRVALVDDVVSDGASKLDTIKVFEEHDLEVICIAVFVDREQGGQKLLSKQGYNLITVLNMSEIIQVLYRKGKISIRQVQDSKLFMQKWQERSSI